MNALIQWSLQRRALVVAIAALLAAFGIYTAITMPVDVFPDLTAPTVTVITEAPGMAPIDVESQVTFPIETAVNGAPGVRRVRSSTAVGLSVVWVEFDWGTDIHAARRIVDEKVALARGGLPPEVDLPVLAPISSIMGEILFLSLASDRHDPIEVRTVADTVIRRRLLAVPGVSQVSVLGGGEKQFQVAVAPRRLQAFGVSLDRIADALAAANETTPAGFLIEQGSEYLVSGLGRFRDVAEIAETVVAAVGGVPIRVADLGAVRIGAAPLRGDGSANAAPAVILGIQKQPDANTLWLTEKLDGILDGLAAELPDGMSIDRHIFRQADFIRTAVDNVLQALRDGTILVILILTPFLMNLRATLITLTAIPLSLLASVLILRAIGGTINTMTLGGMAIAVGSLVDDAIIVVENVFRRLRENGLGPPERRQSAIRVVYEASVEIRSSIVFATFIITLVFLPLFFLSGVEGRLLNPLGTSYVVAMFASLLVALTVTPVLCHILLPSSRAVRKGREPAIVRSLKAAYGKAFAPLLDHPWWIAAGGVLALAAALAGASRLGRTFLPEFNEGALTISAVTLPGTSLAESNALGRLVEETLLSHPEVLSVARRTGRAELDEHAQGVESAELDVTIALKGRRREEFLDALRRDVSLIPGMNITIGQPISHRIDHMLSGTRASIAVKIFGDDLYAIRRLAEEAQRAMASIEGVVDLSVEPQRDIPILKVRYDRGTIARHGLRIRDIARTVEAATLGVAVSRILDGRDAFDLVLRVTDAEDWTPDTICDLPVDTPAGAKVPLKALADIRRDVGPNKIGREAVARRIVVMCNVAARDVGSVVEECRRRVDPIVARDAGCHVVYGGQFESAIEASRILGLLGIAVVVGIALLLHLAFGSARDAGLVMLNLPLALIGGVAGVYVSGGVLSVASMIGFIAVFGIATRNGIMLVSHIRHLRIEEGVADLREAVVRGAKERIAPVLMTALTTGLALIPLALAGGEPGSEIETPMAIVILFGLLTSMLLNMLVIPALYLRFGRPIAKGGTT